MNEGLTLVIDRREISMRIENNALRVDFSSGQFQRFPLAQIETIVIYGSPQVRCDVWRRLAERNVAVAMMPSRGKGEVCWLGGGLTAFVHHRRNQFEAHADSGRRLDLACWMIQTKIRAKLALLVELEVSDVALRSALERAVTDTLIATHSSQLLGVEGAAARAWYEWLRSNIGKHWQFESRNRRPPKDPVNALLSLGYTLALGTTRNHVSGAGFDPYLGFLHEVAPARAALALDLTEPLRPGVDAFVLGLLDDVLTPEDFTMSAADGCRLTKPARAKFYSAWSQWCERWPAIGLERATVARSQIEIGAHESEAVSDSATVSLNQTVRRVVAAFRLALRPAEKFS